MTLDVAWAIDWVRRSAQTVTEHRQELIELDRQIGDGDHGENLFRGFSAVVAKLDALDRREPADIGEVLKLVATTLMSTVGGAAGPLYGTAYLRAAKATGVRRARQPRASSRCWRRRSRASSRAARRTTGEKTMVDAWTPAVEAAVAAADAGASPAAGARRRGRRRATRAPRPPSRSSRRRAARATSGERSRRAPRPGRAVDRADPAAPLPRRPREHAPTELGAHGSRSSWSPTRARSPQGAVELAGADGARACC